MVIAVRAELITLLVVGHIFTEGFLALLAHESHFRRLAEAMVLGLGVALGTIEPLLTARCPDGNLRVQDMFAG